MAFYFIGRAPAIRISTNLRALEVAGQAGRDIGDADDSPKEIDGSRSRGWRGSFFDFARR